MAKRFTAEQVTEFIEIARKANLEGLDFLDEFTVEEIREGFNGIGPEFMRDEMRQKISEDLEIFLPAAMGHDMRFNESDGTRQGYLYANDEFRRNCIKLADYKYGFFDRRRYRMRLVAEVLYLFVSADCFGWKAWRDAYEKNMERNLPEA